MKKLRFMKLFAVISVLALVATACKSNKSGERAHVSVWFQGAMSGPYNYLVLPAYQGAALRARELNADANFPATIELKQGDTQGDPAQTPPVVSGVVADPDTVAVIGPAFSGESFASDPTYDQAGIPFITPSATNPDLANRDKFPWTHWFRIVANDSGQGTLAARYLAEIVGAKNVFVSHDKGSYGQGLATVVRDTLQGAGVQVAGFEGITSGAADFSAFISSVQASGADALFFGGYDADFGKIVKQARDAGLDIPFMSADGSTSVTFLQLAGTAGVGTNLICPCNLKGDFVKKYTANYSGVIGAVPIYAAEGYDAMSLIGEGIKTTMNDNSSATPKDLQAGITKYLGTLTPDSPFHGVSKEIAFDPKTHDLVAKDPESLYYFYKVEIGKTEVYDSEKGTTSTVDAPVITSLGVAPSVLGS